MALTITSPDELRWKVKRLVVPQGFRPLSRHDVLDAATPRRTIVEGVDRRVPDAMGGVTGPLPLGFLLLPLALPFLPFALLLRRFRLLPWTIEARTYPWGRRYPPIVLTYAVRGAAEARRAVEELAAALEAGVGAPVIGGAEKVRQKVSADGGPSLVGSSGPKQF